MLLRQNHPAGRLLRSDHVPLVASFLQRVFITPNVQVLSQADLVEALENKLFSLREQADEGYTSTTCSFFVGAENDVSVAGEFAEFGTNMSELRKKLRNAGFNLFDTFRPYSAWFRCQFRRRYGFLDKPPRIRFRILDQNHSVLTSAQ